MQKLLIIDDEYANLTSLRLLLEKNIDNIKCLTASNANQALKQLSAKPLVVILDLNLNSGDGTDGGYQLLREIKKIDETIRIIVLTGHTDEEFGIKALGLGAANFFTKPIESAHFVAIVKDSLIQANLKRSYLKLLKKEEFELSQKILGSSVHVEELINSLTFAGRSEQAVLISGETGTGKGFSAELIHKISNRAKQNFVKVQAVYNNTDLVSSELFGYQKGAFTGSVGQRVGLLDKANGGTLFLDEINSFSPSLQVALLGVLQDQKFRPLGSNSERSSDFKLISASNQNLETAVELGSFRQDLYFRIAAIKINLLPLRERKEDIPFIAKSFLQGNTLHINAIDKLLNYDWPGNIRELQAVINNGSEIAKFAERKTIKPDDINFMSVNLNALSGGPNNSKNFHDLVKRYKSELVRKALIRNDNSKAKTARELGIDRATVSKLLSNNY